jgi:IS30 family transposase
MAEDLTENRSLRGLTDAEKGQILELNAHEYQHARIAQLLSRSESTICSFLDK